MPNKPSKPNTQQHADNTFAYTSAPYRFVPVSENVFFPKEEVRATSQDVPLADGISGSLSLELAAFGPLLVGDGQEHKDKNGIREVHFFKAPNGQAAIPGSAVRGMLVNLLKIAMLGKMNRMDDGHIAMRDLTKAAIDDYQKAISHTLSDGAYASLVQTGWLSFKNGHWRIQPCEHARVERVPAYKKPLQKDTLYEWIEGKRAQVLPESNIRKDYDAFLASNFGGRLYEFPKPDDKRPPKLYPKRCKFCDMLEHWSQLALVAENAGSIGKNGLVSLRFTPSPLATHQHSRKRLQYRKASQIGDGTTLGYLIPVAHPGANKHMEFLFFDKAEHAEVELTDQEFQDFQHAYESSEAWKHWRKQILDGQAAPVFFLPRTDKHALRLGFSQMFKLPSPTSLHAARIQRRADDALPDWVELIFGRLHTQSSTPAQQAQSWQGKGRVDFSLAVLESGSPTQTIVKNIIPGTPKPSYYPHYLEQKPVTDKIKPPLVNWLQNNVRLRGWKRYACKEFDTQMLDDIQQAVTKLDAGKKTKQSARLHFLQAQDSNQPLTFTLQMRFHNLRPFELGALLWALSWGGDQDCFHLLGMGKPYGAGKVQFRFKELRWRSNQALNQAWRAAEAAGEQDDDSLLTALEQVWQSENAEGMGKTGSQMLKWREEFVSRMERQLGNKWRQGKTMRSLIALAQVPKDFEKEQWQYMPLKEFQEAKRVGKRLENVKLAEK